MSQIIKIATHNPMGRWTQFYEVPSESNPNNAYIVSGNGDVIEPDESVAAIGSGGPFALAAIQRRSSVVQLLAAAGGASGRGATSAESKAIWR